MEPLKIKISKCYCQIPLKKLVKLVQLRFIEGIGTQELMSRMESEEDRKDLAIVALLDVKEQDLIEMVEAEDPSLLPHLLACRARAQEILEHKGFVIGEKLKNHGTHSRLK